MKQTHYWHKRSDIGSIKNRKPWYVTVLYIKKSASNRIRKRNKNERPAKKKTIIGKTQWNTFRVISLKADNPVNFNETGQSCIRHTSSIFRPWTVTGRNWLWDSTFFSVNIYVYNVDIRVLNAREFDGPFPTIFLVTMATYIRQRYHRCRDEKEGWFVNGTMRKPSFIVDKNLRTFSNV